MMSFPLYHIFSSLKAAFLSSPLMRTLQMYSAFSRAWGVNTSLPKKTVTATPRAMIKKGERRL